jgi:hypothetical protein
MPAALPSGITPFKDNDRGFFAWLQSNPDGYFINSERNPKPRYLILHRPNCPHFYRVTPRSTGRRTTSSFARPTARS